MFELRLTTDTLQHINVSSYILNLFLNVQQQILDYCTYTLRPYGLKPSVIALDSSTILFISVSGITRSCAGLPDVLSVFTDYRVNVLLLLIEFTYHLL